MHVKFIEELPEALYSTAGWDTWSKLQEGDDEAQLRLAPGGDGGGLPGAHETFGEAGPHNEVRLHRVVHLPLSVLLPITYYLLPTTAYSLGAPQRVVRHQCERRHPSGRDACIRQRPAIMLCQGTSAVQGWPARHQAEASSPLDQGR
eukprot:scaffold33967_cov41-Phaeocystis_antarctica.AAC.3